MVAIEKMNLYLQDAYVKSFSALVTKVDGAKVSLSTTAFYPRGGGQPCDLGTLSIGSEEYQVQEVRKEDGIIFHKLDRVGLDVGDKVLGLIDWDRRYKLMRAHTASHVISAVMHKKYGAKITGNQLSTEKIRIDFSLERFDRELLDEVVKRANVLLAQDFSVTVSSLPRNECLKDPSLVKLAGIMPPALENWRIVAIGDIDRQADGGTHVHSTGEVGSLSLLKAENKGKSNRRIYLTLNS